MYCIVCPLSNQSKLPFPVSTHESEVAFDYIVMFGVLIEYLLIMEKDILLPLLMISIDILGVSNCFKSWYFRST